MSEATMRAPVAERVRYVQPRVQTFTAEQLQTTFAEVYAQSAFGDVYQLSQP